MTKPAAKNLKSEKGPFVDLPAHPGSCGSLEELLEYVRGLELPLAADLFCGAGGLSLGLEEAGFASVVGVDFDTQALQTYRNLFPGIALELDLFRQDAIDEVVRVLSALDVTLIAGGPPCQPFSRAGRASIRKLIETGARDPVDRRRDLWQSFLEIIARVQPPAVLMENVPDIALGDEGIIIRLMIGALEGLGYSVYPRLVDAWRYGVPQHRKRLLLVALHDYRDFDWPAESEEMTTVDAAIGDLPAVEGGWNEAGGPEGFVSYDGPITAFQRAARRGINPRDEGRMYDHVTRAVREDDRLAFAQMDSSTSYADLDETLKRYRDDIFDDKYKRLDPDDLSRTIIAHLAKDGYGFIHPRQHRTLTVREAARLQTFPDRVRFHGPPTSAFRQIGNAVPPLLGERVGVAILEALEAREPGTGFSTTRLAKGLSAWYKSVGKLSQPWLASKSNLAMIVGDILLQRSDAFAVKTFWPLIEKWRTPRDLIDDPHLGDILEMLSSEGTREVLEIARHFDRHPDDLLSLDGLLRAPSMSATSARLVSLASDTCDDDMLFENRGVLRVVARYNGSNVDRANQGSEGRVELIRMVGLGDEGRLANLALVELARSKCVPVNPGCPQCPLVIGCVYARASGRREQPALF